MADSASLLAVLAHVTRIRLSNQLSTHTQATERVAPLTGSPALPALVRSYGAAVLVTLLVLAGALFGAAPLANGATGRDAVSARLVVGWDYVVLAPLNNVLDTLSVLTLGQHYAVLVTLILLFVGWRVMRARHRPDRAKGTDRAGLGRRLGREAAIALIALLALAAFYAYGILGPRPMAALVPSHQDVLVFDVHSHTDHSHDGRRGFDAEDRREWHGDAGFHAAYVSDHRTYGGYEDGADGNPERAGQGTVLLPGLEIKFDRKYASVLGESWRYLPAASGNTLIPDSLYRVMRETGARPTLILTLPSGLGGVRPSSPDSIGFVGIELSDASPRGLRQSRRDREIILRMADSLDLAVVAATNNHGWGRTAAAWTLMRLEGWHQLTPDQLNAAIERKLHEDRRNATWVVERRVVWLGASPVALAATVPAAAWTLFGGIGAAERVSWLLWSWLLALVLSRRRLSVGRNGIARTAIDAEPAV